MPARLISWPPPAALAGGTGAGVGALLARRVDREHAKHLDEHVQHGGLIRWVRTPDNEHEQAALDVLFEHGGNRVRLQMTPPTKALASIPTRQSLLSFGPAA